MDIEYEKDGKKKVTQERFKEELAAEGWKVVEKTTKKKTTKKKKDDSWQQHET